MKTKQKYLALFTFHFYISRWKLAALFSGNSEVKAQHSAKGQLAKTIEEGTSVN